MPVYIYGCSTCQKRRSVFFRSQAAVDPDPPCPVCEKRGMTKLVGRVSAPKSEDARMEAMSDPSSLGDLDENDPRSVARWARRMGSEMGEDLGDDFVDEMMEGDGAGESGGDFDL
jgi:putative FmdB family regulatory protein